MLRNLIAHVTAEVLKTASGQLRHIMPTGMFKCRHNRAPWVLLYLSDLYLKYSVVE
jgi:hypothetical protein